MEDSKNLEVCLAHVNQLSLTEKEALYRTLQRELRHEQASRFHVTFNQELITSGRIQTATSDLSILNIED